MGLFILQNDIEDPNIVIPSRDYKVSLDSNNYIFNKRSRYSQTNIPLYQGDSELLLFTVFRDQNTVNLVGSTIQISIKATEIDTSFIYQSTISDAVNGSDFGVGKFAVLLPQTLTSSLPYLSSYDIQMTTNSSNFVTTLVSGQFNLVQQVG